MKCKKCGAEGILINDQSPRYRIYKCPNGTCDYGCFGEYKSNGQWKEL